MCANRALIRVNLVRSELECLRAEIDDWLVLRRDLDRFLQYSTQLNTLEIWMREILRALEECLGRIQACDGLRQVYQTCHDVETKLIWTRQVWRYFADKFDQRDNPKLERALAAADEVVWSCYAGVYSTIPGSSRLAVPLPFIEPLYSPNAIPRDQPYVLRNRVISASFLQEFLSQLPLPVIGLPEKCARSPWWLIYVGHETAHHLQHDLLPDMGLVIGFRAFLHDSALSAADAMENTLSTAPATLVESWGSWGEEVFADAMSVHSLGPWAAWALAELILGDDRAMLTELDGYPSAVVRLALATQLSLALEPNGPVALSDADIECLTTAPPLTSPNDRGDLRALARDHLALVPGLVSAIQAYDCGGIGQLRNLCRWRDSYFVPHGEVDAWRDRLLSSNPFPLKPSLDAPRLILSAGLAAWSQLDGLSNLEQRAESEKKLSDRLVDAVIGSRQEGKRSAPIMMRATDLESRSTIFAQSLLDRHPEELGL